MDVSRTILFDGLEGSFLGYLSRCGQPLVAVYDENQVIQDLMDQGMDEDEAMDYLEFNITGGWLGEGTPGLLVRCVLEEFTELCKEQ